MKKETTNNGIGFLGLLTIVFIVLKLTNVITWSWWWVLGAFWIPIVVGLTIMGIILLVAIIVKRIYN